MARYEDKKAHYDELTKEIADSKASAEIIGNFVRILRDTGEAVPEFRNSLWSGMADSLTVYSKDRVEFTLKGGLKITL